MLREDGIKEHVFLLDEQLKIEGIGLVSQKLAAKPSVCREGAGAELTVRVTIVIGAQSKTHGSYIRRKPFY